MSTGRPDDRIYVGVVRLAVQVRGARSLKDRRQALVSIRDRMRHRFDVTFHEIGDSPDDPSHRVVVLTTAGNDPKVVRSVLDQCARMFEEHPVAAAVQVDVDVFRWHASDSWADRMMAELGASGEADE